MTLDEYRDYYSKKLEDLRAFARQRVGDPSAAEDAVQRTFARLLENDGYQRIDAACPDGFVLTTLRHIITDAARKRQPAAAPELGHVAEPGSSRSGESASLGECEALVGAAVAAMQDRERRALWLHLSGTPRADALGRMPGYDAALNRARARMRDHLEHRPWVVARLGGDRLLAMLHTSEG